MKEITFEDTPFADDDAYIKGLVDIGKEISSEKLRIHDTKLKENPTYATQIIDGLTITKGIRAYFVNVSVPSGTVTITFSEISRSRQSFETILNIQLNHTEEGKLPAFEQRIDINSATAISNLATSLNSAYGNKKEGYNWVLILNKAGNAIKKYLLSEKTPRKINNQEYQEDVFILSPFLEEGTSTMIFGDGSCFADGTLVNMADGTQKAIEKISVGEEVITWDGFEKRIGVVSEQRRWVAVPKPMIQFSYEYKNRQEEYKKESITATYDHPFWDGEKYYPLYQFLWREMEEHQRVQLKLLCEQYGTNFDHTTTRGISHRDTQTWERPYGTPTNRIKRENSKGAQGNRHSVVGKSSMFADSQPQGREPEEQQDRKLGMVHTPAECNTRLRNGSYKRESYKGSGCLSILYKRSIYGILQAMGFRNIESAAQENPYTKKDGTIRQITRAVSEAETRDDSHVHIKTCEINVLTAQPYNSLSIEGEVHTYVVGNAEIPVHNTGKTYFALQMIATAYLERPFFGFPTKRIRALFIDYEDAFNGFVNRMHYVAGGLGVELQDIQDAVDYYKPEGSMRDESEIVAKMVEEGQYDVIIIDAGADASGGSPMDEKAVLDLFNSLNKIECTKIIIHHEPKRLDGVDAEKAYYGTTYWRNRVRIAWRLSCESKESPTKKIIKATMTKANNMATVEPFNYVMEFVNEQRKITFKQVDEWAKSDEVRVLEVLSDGAADELVIANGAGMSRSQAQRAISKLMDTGKIERKRDGRKYAYYVPERV